jgi:DNA-binding protein HU-beta
VIKLDIINEVVNRTGITKTKAELAVETVFESMKKALSTGDRIELRGFGVFNVRPRKTGIGRNPRTGAEVSIPPGQSRPLQAGQGTAIDRLAVAIAEVRGQIAEVNYCNGSYLCNLTSNL